MITCHNDLCAKPMDNDPPVTASILDSETGVGLWGHYCNVKCALTGMGNQLMKQLQEGGTVSEGGVAPVVVSNPNVLSKHEKEQLGMSVAYAHQVTNSFIISATTDLSQMPSEKVTQYSYKDTQYSSRVWTFKLDNGAAVDVTYFWDVIEVTSGDDLICSYDVADLDENPENLASALDKIKSYEPTQGNTIVNDEDEALVINTDASPPVFSSISTVEF